jgi:hypothetical protein
MPNLAVGYEIRGNPSSTALHGRLTAQKFARAATKQRLAKFLPALR